MFKKVFKKRKEPIAILQKQGGFEIVCGKPTFLLKNGHGLKHNIGDIVIISDGGSSYRYQIIHITIERKIFTRLILKHTLWQ